MQGAVFGRHPWNNFCCGVLGRPVMLRLEVQYPSCTLWVWVRKEQVGSR